MAQEELDLLCIGNALVDVFAAGDEETLIRHGITRPVQHVEYEKIKKILDEYDSACPRDNSNTIIMSSGGGSGNVAKIAGFLGTQVCFTGAVGKAVDNGEEPDNLGRLFREELISAGVKLSLSLKPSPTGVCLYLRTGKEIHIAASPSAALELSESDINEEDLQKAKVVVIDGFILGNTSLVRRVLELADKYGKTAALDLSSVSIAAEHAAEIAEYARKYSLILFMNEREAEAFYKRMRNEGSLLPEIFKFFESFTAGKSFPIIVVKLGGQGAVCFAGGIVYRAETQTASLPETTGAGDAFCAAFLSAWVRNKPITECAALGNKAARIILDVMGTRVEGKKLTSIARLLNIEKSP